MSFEENSAAFHFARSLSPASSLSFSPAASLSHASVRVSACDLHHAFGHWSLLPRLEMRAVGSKEEEKKELAGSRLFRGKKRLGRKRINRIVAFSVRLLTPPIFLSSPVARASIAADLRCAVSPLLLLSLSSSPSSSLRPWPRGAPPASAAAVAAARPQQQPSHRFRPQRRPRKAKPLLFPPFSSLLRSLCRPVDGADSHKAHTRPSPKLQRVDKVQEGGWRRGRTLWMTAARSQKRAQRRRKNTLTAQTSAAAHNSK